MDNVLFDYGTPLYYVLIALIAPFILILFLILKNRSHRTKSVAISIITLLNLFVHIFKLFIFPHYSATAENAYMCTAYTTCALIIITSPFILIGKSDALKDFLFVVGGAAGIFALIFPHSVISASAAGNLSPWEIVRYYLNHYLIIASSILPVALKLHKINYRNFIKLPIIFLLYHITVFANDAVLICAGYMGEYDSGTLYEGLCFWNPSRAVLLTDTSPVVLNVMSSFINALTPKIFLTDINGESFLWPILYYTPALSIGIMLLEIIEYAIGDFARIKSDVLTAASFLKLLFKGKNKIEKKPRAVKVEPISKRQKYRADMAEEIFKDKTPPKIINFTPTPPKTTKENMQKEKKTERTIVFIRPE